jgi:hypothetical protein
MGKKIEKVKTHFVENQKLYIGVGIGIVVTAVAVVIFRQPTNEITGNIQKVLAFKTGDITQSNPVIINLVERSTPSKPVHLVGTNLFFDSLHEAARQTGHSVSRISKNVNGHIPDVHGDIFRLIDSVS